MNSIQELIDFAESIPEDQWLVGYFHENGKKSTIKQKACFIGHLNFHLTGDYMKGIFLGGHITGAEIGKTLSNLNLDDSELKDYNNGTDGTERYGETPKARIKSLLQSKLVK